MVAVKKEEKEEREREKQEREKGRSHPARSRAINSIKRGQIESSAACFNCGARHAHTYAVGERGWPT